MISRVLLGIFFSCIAMVSLTAVHSRRFGAVAQPAPCYFVARNVIAFEQRDVVVMINEEDFSANTLTSLFGLLFQQYTEPARMYVTVDTDRSQFFGQTALIEKIGPEEYVSEEDKHPAATLFRRNGNEFIRYTMPGDKKWRVIVLRGKEE